MRESRARVTLATALDHFLGIAREDEVSLLSFFIFPPPIARRNRFTTMDADSSAVGRFKVAENDAMFFVCTMCSDPP
jgi:hypothetical protein